MGAGGLEAASAVGRSGAEAIRGPQSPVPEQGLDERTVLARTHAGVRVRIVEVQDRLVGEPLDRAAAAGLGSRTEQQATKCNHPNPALGPWASRADDVDVMGTSVMLGLCRSQAALPSQTIPAAPQGAAGSAAWAAGVFATASRKNSGRALGGGRSLPWAAAVRSTEGTGKRHG